MSENHIPGTPGSSVQSRRSRVILADDHTMAREGIRRILEAEEDLQVIAESGQADETLHLAAQLQPDILVVRMALARNAPADFVRLLRDRLLPSSLVIVADDVASAAETLSVLGIRAIVSSRSSVRDLIAAIRTVRDGGTYLSSQIPVSAPSPAEMGSPENLTARELEVLHLVARGLSNREIALRMSISQRTVQFHLGHAFAKLGASSRTEAVYLARQRGWIQ